MLQFRTGNLLESGAEALVNTVNTVGVMGKGIALMFKENFPENFRAYAKACKQGDVRIGHVFVTERPDWVAGTRWIVNFPTKQHWRHPSKIEWIEEGLEDLKRFVIDKNVRSIAIPPLGSGNGGLDWIAVKSSIARVLSDLHDVNVTVFEPTSAYQNIVKRAGVENLTAARALIAEAIRQYGILGMECSLLEIQKLAYFLEQAISTLGLGNPLKLGFKADRYGPYSPRLAHLLDGLDGSYLHCNKRVADAGPLDVIWFEESKKEKLLAYLGSEAKQFLPALQAIKRTIDGFESPLGLELLATVDWLLRQGVAPNVDAMKLAIREWPGGESAAARKHRIFDDRLLGLALSQLEVTPQRVGTGVPLR